MVLKKKWGVIMKKNTLQYLTFNHEVIGSVARNTVGRYLAFDFIRDKWAVVKD